MKRQMVDRDKMDAFLSELAELTRKYGICIGGCGCCGSPWLAVGGVDKYDKSYHIVATNLTWGDEGYEAEEA